MKSHTISFLSMFGINLFHRLGLHGMKNGNKLVWTISIKKLMELDSILVDLMIKDYYAMWISQIYVSVWGYLMNAVQGIRIRVWSFSSTLMSLLLVLPRLSSSSSFYHCHYQAWAFVVTVKLELMLSSPSGLSFFRRWVWASVFVIIAFAINECSDLCRVIARRGENYGASATEGDSWPTSPRRWPPRWATFAISEATTTTIWLQSATISNFFFYLFFN